MENRARYTLIGAFTLVCILASFGFVYWIKAVGGLGDRALYSIRFEQPASGLTEGANVLFNGIRAGSVARLDFDATDPKRVTALISVAAATPIRADTQVSITYLGLTGAAAIALKGGSAAAPQLAAQNGQPPVLVAGADAGRTLTESAQETLHHIDDILKENQKPLNTAIKGIATFADMLGNNSKRVEGLIGGLETLTGAGKPKETPAVYDLAAASDFPAFERSITAQLVVADPNTILLFDTQNILTRDAAGTYATLNNVKWADTLPKLVQARIVQSFENAHQLAAVSRPLEQLAAAYRLEVGIRTFQLSLQGKPTAVVDLTARLVNDKGAVAGARIFSASVPAKGADAPDAVAALNRAFTQVASEIVAWTIGAI